MIITDESKLRIKSELITNELAASRLGQRLIEVLKLKEREVEAKYTPEEAIDKKDKINFLGLSAIQIGESKRVFVLQPEKNHFDIYINPKIIDQYDELIYKDEGCLSFPGKYITTKRFKYVVLETSERKRIFSDMLAIAVQHECDHLDGILFMDRAFKGIRVDSIGRNEPCSCGSGKKYKKCCGRN